MNYAMVFSSDERIFTSRSQGLLGSGTNLFLPMGSPLALNLKYSLNFWIYFKGAGQRVELPFLPVDESHLHMPE